MKEKILDIIEKVCEDDSIREDLTMNLFEEDLLDSLSFVELLVELEDNLGVVISPSEVTREDMDTPEKIIARSKHENDKSICSFTAPMRSYSCGTASMVWKRPFGRGKSRHRGQ